MSKREGKTKKKADAPASRDTKEVPPSKAVKEASISSSSSNSFLFLAVGIVVIAIIAAFVLGPDSISDILSSNRSAGRSMAADGESNRAAIQNSNSNVCFTLAPNGNGTVEGIHACANEFKNVDDVIEKYCATLCVNNPSLGKGKVTLSQCSRGEGARLVTHSGIRVFDLNRDILDGERVYIVPQGLHFQWPLVKVGNIIYPRNVRSPIEGRPIRLVQLSDQPRVFQVENFVSDEEVAEILAKNKPRMTPSEVGFAGWQDSTRTSSTSWDTFTRSARQVQKRTFDILAMDYDLELADAVQVLRYEKTQWYKPHTDFFDSKGYDDNDPTVNNGTNRFATMFLYLSTVTQGGHTVFPHSTSHIGYNGEKLVHDGTINTASYIDTNEAVYCCNVSSTALRSPPIKGNAVLFYSQLADGSLDNYSLHGGCPPTADEEKWSANVWIWNRPKPDKSKAKDKPNAQGNKKSIDVIFVNEMKETIKLYWDPNFGMDPDEGDAFDSFVEQAQLAPEQSIAINTYMTHTFFATIGRDKKFKYVASKEDDAKRISIKWQ